LKEEAGEKHEQLHWGWLD